MIITGTATIAGIGFAGSYTAVRDLALKKGFGNFSYVFPIGIDAGICVLLALDLLLTWIRIPFPLLRQTAWLLTAATIAFNAATAWPDPLGTGMHAVIPILFVITVEAARHAIGRIADITADKHTESVRITRWLLSPLPTFLLWRRMKLWELRSYDQAIKLEQERLVYQARLRSRFGRAWRRKAPVEALTPLRLARHGIPLTQTAPAGLAAAGIQPALPPPPPEPAPRQEPTSAGPAGTGGVPAAETTPAPRHEQAAPAQASPGIQAAEPEPQWQHPALKAPARRQKPAQPGTAAPHPPVQAPPADFRSPHSSHRDDAAPAPRIADARQARHAAPGTEPTSAQAAFRPPQHHAMTTTAGAPLPHRQPQPPLKASQPHTPSAKAEPETRLHNTHSTDHTPIRDDSVHNAQLPHAAQPGRPDHAAPASPTHPHGRSTGADGQPAASSTPHAHACGPGPVPPRREQTDTAPGEQRADARRPSPHHLDRRRPADPDHPARRLQETPPHDTDAPPPAPPPIPQSDTSPGEQQPAEPARHPTPTPQPPPTGPSPTPQPTTVDRYYQAWADFHHRHRRHPDAAELSAHLAEHGILDRSRQPVKPKSLSRYLLQFHLYTAWARHRTTTPTPDLHLITQELTHHGITAQYNKPLQPHHLTPHLPAFEHRWHSLNPHPHHTRQTS
nr:DUF2637 domain-containing protein [Streptomyces sp. 3214.6]